MTSKERFLKSISCVSTDRIAFWPKLFDMSYVKAQKAPFCNMTLREIYDFVGCEMQVFLPWHIRAESDGCTSSYLFEDKVRIRKFETPHRTVEAKDIYDKCTNSYYPVKNLVTDVEDIKALTYFYKSAEPMVTEQEYKNAVQIANKNHFRGVVADFVGESPLMNFLEWFCGIENGHYLLHDYQEECEELFFEYHNYLKKVLKLKCDISPADILYFIENTSTSIISVNQFRKYCMRHLKEYCDIAVNSDRRLAFHMCGHLKDLLPDIAALDCSGIESYTTKPLGNTTIKDATDAFNYKKSIIGAGNAVIYEKSAEEIINNIDEELSGLKSYKGIILGTGGIAPPTCSPETLKTVFEHIKNIEYK